MSDDGDLQTICGTDPYSAPEIGSGNPYDSRVDIHSMGIIIFELLMGEEPGFIQSDDPDVHEPVDFSDPRWEKMRSGESNGDYLGEDELESPPAECAEEFHDTNQQSEPAELKDGILNGKSRNDSKSTDHEEIEDIIKTRSLENSPKSGNINVELNEESSDESVISLRRNQNSRSKLKEKEMPDKEGSRSNNEDADVEVPDDFEEFSSMIKSSERNQRVENLDGDDLLRKNNETSGL
ncbi:hypothetical protein HK098_006482 [Nowakowskiella sp. JEL0407]|nr:hypothetical protein HK098_006482 [Nowakowskiella sp. JEL0407]